MNEALVKRDACSYASGVCEHACGWGRPTRWMCAAARPSAHLPHPSHWSKGLFGARGSFSNLRAADANLRAAARPVGSSPRCGDGGLGALLGARVPGRVRWARGRARSVSGRLSTRMRPRWRHEARGVIRHVAAGRQAASRSSCTTRNSFHEQHEAHGYGQPSRNEPI